MKKFKKITALALSLLCVFSVCAAGGFSASAEAVEEEAYLEGFSGSVGSDGFVNGWTGDSSLWELVALGSNQAEYYKGGSVDGAAITSKAMDLSKYTSAKMYISIGIKEGLTLDESNTLKIMITDGASYSKTCFNLHTGQKYDAVKSADASLKSFWFDITDYLPTNKNTIHIKVTALGAHPIYVDDITILGTYDNGGAATTTTPGANGNQIINSVAVDIPSPAVGAAQPAAVNGTGFTGSIVWNPAGTFAGGASYTATVTLTAASGYEFSSGTAVSVSTSSAQNVNITPNQLTFTAAYTIESTAVKITKISYDYVTRTTAQLVMETSGNDPIIEQYFEYGTSIGAYTGKSVDGALTDLSSNTIYYYRAVVVTAAGQITSEPSNFRTAAGITIVTKSSSGGTVSPPGTSEVATGDSLTVTITPDDGYVINFVTVDDADVQLSEDGTYTFTNIGEDHVLYAAFKPSVSSADSEKSGKKWFVKFIIIFLGVVLASLIFLFFVKPKGVGFGDIIAGAIVKVRRWNFRRKGKGRKKSRSEDYYSKDDGEDFDSDEEEYGYDDDDLDDGLPIIGNDITENGADDSNGQDTSYGGSSYSDFDDFDDDFSKKYDFDRFK